MLELLLLCLANLVSERGVNLMFVALCLWAADGANPRVVMWGSAALYGLLVMLG